MRLFRQFHSDVLKARSASIGEDSDMGSVDGVRDTAAERLDIVHVENDDLILADQFDMMDAAL